MPRSVSAVVHWILSAAVFTFWIIALQLAWNRADPLWFTFAIVAVLSLASEVVHDLYRERKSARREGRPRASFFALADRPVALPARSLDGALLGKLAVQLVYNVVAVVGLGWAFGHRDFRLLPLAVLFLALYVVGKAFVGDGWDRNRTSPFGSFGARLGV